MTKNKTFNNGIVNSIKNKIIPMLSGRKDITLVFIFGSAASNQMTSSSDLDIAILFNTVPDFNKINEIRGEIAAKLNREIDLVLLNNASPIIRMQVLRKGILLLNNNKTAYYDFIIKAVNEYDDLKKIRKGIEINILKGRIYA